MTLLAERSRESFRPRSGFATLQLHASVNYSRPPLAARASMSKQKIKTPKQILLEVFSTFKAEAPKFDFQPGPPPPAPPIFLCTVNLQAIDCKHGAFAKQEFQAEGPNKKSAMHSACLKALKFIEEKRMLPPDIHVPSTPATAAADEFLKGLGQEIESGKGVLIATPSGGGQAANSEEEDIEAEIARTLNGRLLESLSPQELREELEKVLQTNTNLLADLHHEKRRRQRAEEILLGLA